jgi:hypothetical protein
MWRRYLFIFSLPKVTLSMKTPANVRLASETGTINAFNVNMVVKVVQQSLKTAILVWKDLYFIIPNAAPVIKLN